MANFKLNFKGYQKNEAKVTKSFLAGNVDKGFKLLWSLLEEKPQLNFKTLFVIISCFVGDERDDYFDNLKSGILKFNPPDKILIYLEFRYYLLTQNLPRIDDEVKRLEKLKFPLDVIARNLHDGGQFKLAIKISRKYERKHPKNIENLEILLRCYTELHDWNRMKKIADKIIHIDPENVSAICKLARSEIVKENYTATLKHLDIAEEHDPNNAEIQLLRAVSYHFLKRYKDVNLPIRRAIDSMIESSVDSQKIASAYAVLLYSQAKIDQINRAIETWDLFRSTLKDDRLLYDGLMEIPLNIDTLGLVMEICNQRLEIEFKGSIKDIEELKEFVDIIIIQSKELALESVDLARAVQKNISFNEYDTLILENTPTIIDMEDNSSSIPFSLGIDSISHKSGLILISQENYTFLYFLALERQSSTVKTDSTNKYWMYDPLEQIEPLIKSYQIINKDFHDILETIEVENSVLYKNYTEGLGGDELELQRRRFYRKVGGKWPLDYKNKIKKKYVSEINSEVRKILKNNAKAKLIKQPPGTRGKGGIYTLSKNISIIKFTSE